MNLNLWWLLLGAGAYWFFTQRPTAPAPSPVPPARYVPPPPGAVTGTSPSVVLAQNLPPSVPVTPALIAAHPDNTGARSGAVIQAPGVPGGSLRVVQVGSGPPLPMVNGQGGILNEGTVVALASGQQATVRQIAEQVPTGQTIFGLTIGTSRPTGGGTLQGIWELYREI